LAELRAVHALLRDDLLATSSLAVGNDVSIGTSRLDNFGLLGKLVGDVVSIVFVDTGSKQQVLLLLHFGGVIHVLTWVGCLVFEYLDEFVETGCNDGSENRSEPVNPVIGGEVSVYDCWTE
jgi:hypothetical protein